MRRAAWIVGCVMAAALFIAVVEAIVMPDPDVVPASAVTPFPEPLSIVYDETSSCRGTGDNGFLFRNLIVGPSSAAPDGAVADHLASRGFTLRERSSTGPGWITLQAFSDDATAWVGDADDYVDGQGFDPLPIPGIADDVQQAIADRSGPFTLILLEPVNVSCEAG